MSQTNTILNPCVQVQNKLISSDNPLNQEDKVETNITSRTGRKEAWFHGEEDWLDELMSIPILDPKDSLGKWSTNVTSLMSDQNEKAMFHPRRNSRIMLGENMSVLFVVVLMYVVLSVSVHFKNPKL